jgi:hypothetical protein
MLLKLKRSQRSGGLTGSVAIFCIDARVDLSAAEQADVRRYKLGGQVIYTSDARDRAAAGAALAAGRAANTPISPRGMDAMLEGATGFIGQGLKAAALAAVTHLNLKITIDSLVKGHHIECKSLDELLGAEEAILSACENLNGYLLTAATFDGREVVMEFTPKGPVQVVDATPAPALLFAPTAPSPGPMPPAYQPESEIRAIPERAGQPVKIYASTNGPFDAMLEDARRFIAQGVWSAMSPMARFIALLALIPLTWIVLKLFHMPDIFVLIIVLGPAALAWRAFGELR